MILKGSKRGGAMDLARHLLKPENEHVELHELRGFIADTLQGAMSEAHAVSRGTRCQKFLFSLSLSPPEHETVSIADFESAIERIERKLGLGGQPRAVVFHEKEGRRHAHCVWSRITVETMTAVDLPHYKYKLMDLSRDLYLEHDWKMPAGMIDRAMRNPLNFSMSEWFKAKRSGQNPKDIKAALRQCWEASDSPKAFRSSLENCGFFIAKGDRRAVVAIDVRGEVLNLARWLGMRSKELGTKIDFEQLPSFDTARRNVAELVANKLQSFIANVAEDFDAVSQVTEGKRLAMTEAHRDARKLLQADLKRRAELEGVQRAERFRKGMLGLWDRVTGAHNKIRQQNEYELKAAEARDRQQKEQLVQEQLRERQKLQAEILHARRLQVHRISRILRDRQSLDHTPRTALEPDIPRQQRPRGLDM